MPNIIDTRQMSRADRLAAAEERSKERAILQAQRSREHAERNAAAVKAQQEWRALTPDERAERRRADQAEVRARHEAANAAAFAKQAPGPPENKMLLPAVQNKAPAPAAKPKAEPKAKAPVVPVTAPDATDAAVKLAKKHRVNLSKVKGTGAGGRITVADVEALAK